MDVDRRLCRSPQAVFRSLDEGGVLLDVETGAYFELNASGCFLWQALETSPTFGELVSLASRHYEMDVGADVEAFVRALDERALLESA